MKSIDSKSIRKCCQHSKSSIKERVNGGIPRGGTKKWRKKSPGNPMLYPVDWLVDQMPWGKKHEKISRLLHLIPTKRVPKTNPQSQTNQSVLNKYLMRDPAFNVSCLKKTRGKWRKRQKRNKGITVARVLLVVRVRYKNKICDAVLWFWPRQLIVSKLLQFNLPIKQSDIGWRVIIFALMNKIPVSTQLRTPYIISFRNLPLSFHEFRR